MAEQKSQETHTVTLKTCDDVLFEVEINVVKEMKTIQSFMDDSEDIATIPLANVTSQHLAMIIEYCKKHVSEEENEDAKDKFDVEFTKKLSGEDMKLLIVAANYLNIKSLLDLLARTLADHIKNKSVEFVREFFNVENDFEPEEEAKLRQEAPWAFENLDEN
ncbi:SKP1-like protein 14 [Lathyrus oleraceus]|uniref:SKP1-like protein 14 n=1 Tax=Pisum sativum TaxID=3888 RepID=UPI001FC4E0DF|nr:SKP1-like protein 14 [Pisum sativum]